MGTWIVGLILSAAVVFIVRGMVRDKKQGEIHSVRRGLQTLRGGIATEKKMCSDLRGTLPPALAAL